MGAFFGQPALQEYARLIRSRDFSNPGFALSGAMKDLELMMQAAGDIRAPLPFGSIVRDKLLTAAARGHGGPRLGRRLRDQPHAGRPGIGRREG